jgi:ribonuclease D
VPPGAGYSAPAVSEVPRSITEPAELSQFAQSIKKAGRMALDTEFVWERTYRPVLGVVQIATDSACAILDTIALSDLSPLFPLLRDPKIPVVLHGAGQDLEILATLMGEPVRGVVDTQVLAAFLGYGLQVGLSALLERVLKVKISKDQTYTDWTRRPLKPEQLTYAQQDVLHLLPLYDNMRADLEARGREVWVDEELLYLEDADRYTPTPDEERYQFVKGWQRHSSKELAVLRELAGWRENVARRADVRPNFIANDVVLTTLAGRPVLSKDDLRGVRGLSPGTVDRHGSRLVAAIKAGVDCPKDQWPKRPERERRTAPPTGLAAMLRAAVQVVADREEIAAEVIASTRELEALVAQATRKTAEADEDLPVLKGWRRRLIGETLLALARGELSMRFDPAKREVLTEAVPRRAKSQEKSAEKPADKSPERP